MKKFFVLLITITFLGIVMTSCHQTKPCPAYNSYEHYQRENAF